jgi:NAD(P)-dependent dehydrogenase (short-subunit alcohol dehydrogenase family)
MSSAPLTLIISGASSGIGLALAQAYAREGAQLVLNARDEDKLAQRTSELPTAVELVPGDIADAATATRLIGAAVQRFGRADALINNAGIFHSKPFEQYSEADVDAYLRVNMRGTLLVTLAMVLQLRAQRSPGAIVNITSAISAAPQKALPAAVPNATKAGLTGFTRSLALELAAEGIRVNAVAPGLIQTPLLGDAQLAHLQPVGHVGEPRDIVAAVQYLVREPFVTGVVLPVDGGASLGHW